LYEFFAYHPPLLEFLNLVPWLPFSPWFSFHSRHPTFFLAQDFDPFGCPPVSPADLRPPIVAAFESLGPLSNPLVFPSLGFGPCRSPRCLAAKPLFFPQSQTILPAFPPHRFNPRPVSPSPPHASLLLFAGKEGFFFFWRLPGSSHALYPLPERGHLGPFPPCCSFFGFSPLGWHDG